MRRNEILETYKEAAPKAMKILDDGWNDITAVYAFPPELRKKLRTSNTIERVNGELKRREHVIRIFTNEASILRLMGTILIELNEKWSQRKYMNLSALPEWELEKAAVPMGTAEAKGLIVA